MSETEERMFPQHARSSVAHDDPYLLAPAVLIAVHWAFGARGFIGAKLATVQSQARVIQQALAFFAQGIVVMIATIDANHRLDGLPFTGETVARFVGQKR